MSYIFSTSFFFPLFLLFFAPGDPFGREGGSFCDPQVPLHLTQWGLERILILPGKYFSIGKSIHYRLSHLSCLFFRNFLLLDLGNPITSSDR